MTKNGQVGYPISEWLEIIDNDNNSGFKAEDYRKKQCVITQNSVPLN